MYSGNFNSSQFHTRIVCSLVDSGICNSGGFRISIGGANLVREVPTTDLPTFKKLYVKMKELGPSVWGCRLRPLGSANAQHATN